MITAFFRGIRGSEGVDDCSCCKTAADALLARRHGETDEWLQTVENGIVTACSRTGGKGGWQLYSISRWTAEDGKRLKHHLEIEFEQKKNRQIYWDDVAMFCYPEEYQLGIRPMNKDDIIEVDNLSELIALDASYKKYVEEK